MNKLINLVQIDQSNMSSALQTRVLQVRGEVGARFIVNVIKINSTSKESYYNFKTKTFTNAFVAANNFNVNLSGGGISIPIIFPADATGETYSVIVIPKSGTEFANKAGVVNKKIIQVGQTTIALSADSGKDASSVLGDKYTSDPPDTAVSSVGSTARGIATSVPISWTLTNAASDEHGHGFVLPSGVNQFSIPDSYWFSQTLGISSGTTSSSTTVTLNSVNNLIVGMTLSSVSVDSLSGSPVITAINGNTVTLSVAQSIGNARTLIFRAYGPTLIGRTFGMEVSFSNFVAKGTQLTKTVRTDTTFPASDGTVTTNLNGTYGVSGGNVARLAGFNINENGNNNLIVSVSPSSTAGSVNLTFQGSADDVASSVVPVGTTLYINGCHQEIKIEGTVKVSKYPSANQKLALDLTKFITHGTAS
tara:strand:- start:579 stop:1838 length:1260 start_codon:yes stop_codon:yes gene_type:complete